MDRGAWQATVHSVAKSDTTKATKQARTASNSRWTEVAGRCLGGAHTYFVHSTGWIHLGVVFCVPFVWIKPCISKHKCSNRALMLQSHWNKFMFPKQVWWQNQMYYTCLLASFPKMPNHLYKWKEKVLVTKLCLFVTPKTVACQAPRSMGFSRQEYYWSG